MSYVVLRVYSFACDHPRCGATAEILSESVLDRIRTIRERLQATEGWRSTTMRDFCPQHLAGGVA